jgi:hypothetical protein
MAIILLWPPTTLEFYWCAAASSSETLWRCCTHTLLYYTTIIKCLRRASNSRWIEILQDYVRSLSYNIFQCFSRINTIRKLSQSTFIKDGSFGVEQEVPFPLIEESCPVYSPQHSESSFPSSSVFLVMMMFTSTMQMNRLCPSSCASSPCQQYHWMRTFWTEPHFESSRPRRRRSNLLPVGAVWTAKRGIKKISLCVHSRW